MSPDVVALQDEEHLALASAVEARSLRQVTHTTRGPHWIADGGCLIHDQPTIDALVERKLLVLDDLQMRVYPTAEGRVALRNAEVRQ
jgi:hypothetical protein